MTEEQFERLCACIEEWLDANKNNHNFEWFYANGESVRVTMDSRRKVYIDTISRSGFQEYERSMSDD